jgi:hypothetical protein
MIGHNALARHLAQRQRVQPPLIVGREAFELGGGYVKAGIVHTQRFENALAQKFIQRQTRPDFDQPA